MKRSSYPVWFLGVVSLTMAAVGAFNLGADVYILHHRAGASVQTVSGFERVLKPAWLESIAPNVVFAGSSRVRDGFDPTLIDAAFPVRSFNYGVSSITPYEARRFVQDASAHNSVKLIVLSLDAFSGGAEAQKTGAGFDELRLAVSADGAPTPNRSFWLFVTRYLSGGALGMHALGIDLLAQLLPGQYASDRPDLFEAYSHMSAAGMRRDLLYRAGRSMQMSAWEHSEFRAALASVCRRDIRLIVFFPPDNSAIVARYEANDRAGLRAFKASVLDDVLHHNVRCEGKVSLFDFMRPNAITIEPLRGGVSANYVDLIHFRAPIGVRLFRVMFDPGNAGTDAALGRDLAMLGSAREFLAR